jgi:hypothetical protein
MKHDDGGPAFPRTMMVQPGDVPDEIGAEGMSLRAWLTGMAMQGYAANPRIVAEDEVVAMWSVNLAAATLEVLEKREEDGQ